ncbi:MAG: hypothetical protein IKZ34_01405 [Alphaproteobacteria bacterium]|nr:hypothetical protein [Alphaproteobacteria bacterium]
MTRVLQIRRGTAAEHENFVGLPSEITMDTDTKTIRLHDGQTLGGIASRNDKAGYTTGDDVWAWGIGNRANPNPQPFHDKGGLHIRLMINNEAFWVNHKANCTQTDITDTNWRILYRVYC